MPSVFKWLVPIGLALICALYVIKPDQIVVNENPAKDRMNKSSSEQPIVVFLPHQDDEMFLAGSVKQYLHDGKTVYVAMVTDGGNSAIRSDLNLSRKEFSAARNREFFTSMTRLGIPATHIFFANEGGVEGTENPKYKDGSLTKEQAREVVQTFYNQFGDGIYITIESRKDRAYHRNPDHAALQHALIEFSAVTQKYYFTDIESSDTKIELSTNAMDAKRYALESYYEFDPTHEKFAIGARSVQYLLDKWKAHVLEYRNDF